MEFEAMSAEQYRALDADALEQRRQSVISLLDDPECEVSTEELRSETQTIRAEYERRNTEAQLRGLNIEEVQSGAGSFKERSAGDAGEVETDSLDTAEYRNAFMEYVCHGVAIPAEVRADAATMTTDVPPQIPTTMGKEIIQKMSQYGTIWNKVRKLSVQGGLWFRILDLKPTATWIAEDKVSDYQKVTGGDKISFSFYELECRMAQSLLASAVTFADFQAMFVPAVAEAMVRALEQAIMRGAGTAGPLGITVDPRVTNVVELTAAEFGDWQAWHKKVKAKMPLSYRNGEFTMAQSSWDTYIETMADDQKAPVSIGYNPVTGEEVKRLVGKGVNGVETDILPDFDAAAAGDVVAIFGDFNNYVINTQPGMPMTTKRWIDDDKNQEKIKALMACDGKVLDAYGFILIKKKASA